MNKSVLLILLIMFLGSTHVESQEHGTQDYSTRIKEAYNAANYMEVVSICGAAIDLVGKSSEPNPLTLTRLIDYKAMAHKKLGEYKDAEQCYKKEISLLQDFTSRADDVRCKLGVLYIEMGLFDKAECVLDSVTSRSKMGWSKLHRASSQIRRGNYETAEKLLVDVIENNKDEKDLLASAHQNLGYLMMQAKRQGNFEAISNHLKKALEFLPQHDIEYQAVLANLALCEAKSESYDMALTHINQVVGWFKQHKKLSLVDYIIAIRKKAEILFIMGRRIEAQKVYREFFSLERKYAEKNFSSMTEQNRLDFWKTLRPNISKVFALENDCPDFLLDVALFRREVALLGNANKKEMNKRLSVNSQQIRKALNKNEVAIDFVRYNKKDSTKYGAIIIPSIKTEKPVKFIPLWTEEELHGYKIDGIKRLDDALCSNSMQDKDRLYSDTLLTRLVWDTLDQELEKYDYDDIYFAPDGLLNILAVEYLREDNGVCLHRMTSLSRLIDRNIHTISYKDQMLAAGGLDYDQDENVEETDDFLENHEAMDFLQSQLKHIDKPFSYLKGAKTEIDSISVYSPFPTDTTTVQTEQQFKKSVMDKKYSILHLSTHGYALDVEILQMPEVYSDSITEDRSLLASGIALTSANVAYKVGSAEDGIISAREFCEMDMSNIDLMVLSACQTGLGRFSDEGPAGLVRGLKKAGTGTLIVSLWSVNDEATMLFMKHLYNGLSEQSSPDIHAAFNAARMNFSTETKQTRQYNAKKMKSFRYEESYNQPRYCNSFILIDAI